MQPTSSPQASVCCSHHHENDVYHKESKWDKVIRILEKISAAALGVFAAYVDLKLFLPFAILGIGIGIYNYMSNAKSHSHSHGEVGGACSQGFLEHLTGVKLPPVVSLVTNLAITACHIDHHSMVFVPIMGLSIGAWIGQNAAHYGSLLYHKWQPVVDKSPIATGAFATA